MTNNTTHPNSPPASPWYFFAVVILLLLACIICNSLIVAVFIIKKSIRNNTNMFVLSLACADLVVGMISMPLWIVNANPGIQLHYYVYTIDILCCSASIFNCALLSLERVLKICFPYWYANNVTAFKINVVILLGWIAAVLTGCLSLLRGTNSKNIYYAIFITIWIYILPVIAIFVSYMSIFFVAHKHAKTIRTQNRHFDSNIACVRISEAKTAWRLSIFIIVFVLCWTPFFVKTWASILFLPPAWFNVIANTLTYINAIINPFLYAIFNTSIRKEIRKLFKRRSESPKIGSSRRNEISTAQTNINYSPSISRNASTHLSPPTERREQYLFTDVRKNHLNTCEELLIPTNSKYGLTNNEIMHDSNLYLYETSL